MSRVCTICRHPERAAIDAALVAGVSFRDVAGRYGISKSAVERHNAEHLPSLLLQAHDVHQIAQADHLLQHVRDLQLKASALLMDAERKGDTRTALLGVREARACLELLAKLVGELDERPQVNVLIAPEWLAVRAAIMQALLPHPEARAAVAAQLLTLEAGHDHRG